jgi:hypothetical protein
MHQKFAESLIPLTCIIEHFLLSWFHAPTCANLRTLLALSRHAFFVLHQRMDYQYTGAVIASFCLLPINVKMNYKSQNLRRQFQNKICINVTKYSIFIVVPCILIILKFFSPTNAHFIKHIKCSNLQLKHLCIRSYMFRSICTILREPKPILAKVTLL